MAAPEKIFAAIEALLAKYDAQPDIRVLSNRSSSAWPQWLAS